MKPETPLYARFPPIAARLDWLAPLLVRLVFGYFWLETGWAKLHNLDGFAARFVQWGIPFPELSATVSAGMEFIGGLLLMLGLLTRLTMIPMIFNMIVALVVRSEEHTSELQSLMRISYAVFCLKKKNKVIHQQI